MKRSMWSVVVVALTVAHTPVAGQGQPARKTPAAPKSLLVYYGWPSVVNGANNNLRAASAEFARYDFVVLGGGLQDPKHPDHLPTKTLIRGTKGPQFFGYIPLGNRPGKDKCLPAKVIQAELQGWAAMGVKGVLLDEFGYDYDVTRARQNESVTAAHRLKLRVIANAWTPADVFLPDKAGVAPALDAGDIYLWESYRFAEGTPVPLKAWRDKAAAIQAGRAKLPLAVFSVSTAAPKAPQKNPAPAFAHQWYSAAIDGHAATGWGHTGFGGNGQAPFVPSPVRGGSVTLGERSGDVEIDGMTVTAATTTGVITVNVEKLTGEFRPRKK